MSSQGDFTPPVKAGYKQDGAYHRRNWRALTDFLRTNFISEAHLQDSSVSGIKLADLAVTDAKIQSLAVDKLTTGTLQADVLMSSRIKTGETGQRVEIDANGIRLTDGTNDTVNIPVTGESSFAGGVSATSLRSEEATLAGDTVVDSGGAMRFSIGVADPSAAPTISWTYPQTSLGFSSTLRGCAYDATDSRLLACYPGYNIVGGWPLAGGGWDWNHSLTYTPYGITRIGSFIYVVALTPEAHGFQSIYVYKYSTSGGAIDSLVNSQSYLTFSAAFPGFDHLAGMTNDGTDIYVCSVRGNDDVIVTKFLGADCTWDSTFTLESGFETGDRMVTDIHREDVDGGRWWIVYGNSTTNIYEVRAYTSALARLAAEDFGLPGDSRGVTYSGSEFITTASSGAYYREHSNWRGSFVSEHVKYTWRDSAGPYETGASAQARVTYVQRAFLRVTWPTIPADADQARIYFLENNVNPSPAAGAMKLQGTETGTSQTYSTYISGGAADPGTNTFPELNPARLVLPSRTSAPASPEVGEIYFGLSSGVARVWDGAAWNPLW